MKGLKMNVHGSTSRRYIFAMIGLAFEVFSGCSKHVPSPPLSNVPADVLATVGEERITAEQFSSEMANRRIAGDPKAKKALLDEMVHVRVLAQEARRRGYDRDPQVIAAYDALLAGRLHQEVHAQAKPTSAEIEAYYNAHPAEFNTPAAVRAAVIFVAAPTQMPADVRAQRHAAIDTARQKALALPPNTFGFGMLPAQYSDDPETKPRGGDMGYLVEGAATQRWEKPVLDTAFALPSAGALSEVITTDRGYYLVKLIAKRTASVRPLNVARLQIEKSLTDEKERQLTAELTKEASGKQPVKIYEDHLSAIPAVKPVLRGTR